MVVNTRLRRHFPDREEARKCLSWMKIGKTIRIFYGRALFKSELVTMTDEGLKFHDLIEEKKEKTN